MTIDYAGEPGIVWVVSGSPRLTPMEASPKSRPSFSSPETPERHLKLVPHTPDENAVFEQWLQEHQERLTDERLFGQFLERQQTYEWLWDHDKTSPMDLESLVGKIVNEDKLSNEEVGAFYAAVLDVAQAKLELGKAAYVHLEHPATHIRTQITRAPSTGEVEQLGYLEPTVETIRAEGSEEEIRTLRLYIPQYTISGERRQLVGIMERNTIQSFRNGASTGHARSNWTYDTSLTDLASFVELMVSSKIAAVDEDDTHGEEPPPLRKSEDNEA